MRTEAPNLGDLLLGRTRSRLLATFYDKPEADFSARQLARLLPCSSGTVQRELGTLTATGLISREEREHQVLYRARRNHPIFAELQSLLAKTTGVFHLLREALAPFAGEIEFAFVYGSFARGEERSESDVDLLVVGDVRFDALLEALAPVEARLKRPIHPTIFSHEEIRGKIAAGNHFLRSLQSAPLVVLIGDEGEFREIR